MRQEERGIRTGSGEHDEANSINVDGGVTRQRQGRPIAIAADALNATIDDDDTRVMEEQAKEVRGGGRE